MQTPKSKQIRLTLATVWLVTGVLSLGIYPVQDSLSLLGRVGITGDPALFTLYSEALLHIIIGILTLYAPGRKLWQAQALIIVAYTVVITIKLPEFWLHPFGPILKNLPILTLIWLLHNHEGLTA